MNASLRLGRIFGIPFHVNYSWFGVFAIVAFSLAFNYFPSSFPRWPTAAYLLIGVVTSLLFFGSVVAHELAHSAVSIATGIPVRGITLFIFGGVAEIERETDRPRDELLMAGAGPLASFALSLLFWLTYLAATHFNEPLAAVSWWLALMNLSLGAFNLIPGFPLDGGRMLRSIVWGASGNLLMATRVAAIGGRLSGYVLILVGLLFIFQGSRFEGIWLAFVGWFLDNMANSSSKQAIRRYSLRGVTAGDLMSGDFPAVSPTMSVDDLVAERFLKSAHRTYLVVEDEKLLGLVSPQSIKDLRRDHWDVTSVREVMMPVAQLKKAAISEDAITLLDRMDELDLAQLPVEDEGRIVGLVRRDTLLQLVRTRRELGV